MSGSRLRLLLLLPWLFAAPAAAAPQFAGDVVSQAFEPAAVELVLANGPRARVEFLSDAMVRVRFAPGGAFADEPTGVLVPWTGAAPSVAVTEDAPDAATLETAALRVRYTKQPFRLQIHRADGSPLLVDSPSAGLGWDDASGWVFAVHEAPEEEAYLGLGQRAGALDRRGRSFVLANTDNSGWSELTDLLYISVPFFYVLRDDGRAHGVFLHNPAIPFFDFDTARSGLRTVGALTGEIDLYVFDGPTPAEVSARYTALTGRMPLPPLWSLGYHQARYGYASQQQVLDVANGFRARDIPLDAIHIDIDHMDAFQLFTWDPVRFPDPAGMNAQLGGIGVRSVVLLEPLLRIDDPKWPLFAGSGFFLKEPDSEFPHVAPIWFGTVSFVDFSNPLARFWWSVLNIQFLSSGISGVWNDLNEPAENAMPLDVRHDFGGQPRSHLQARNLYALQHTSMTRESMLELRPDERPFVFSRSGFSGIQRYAANWSGDGLSTWEGLRAHLEVGQSMSISGLHFFGHDIGGFLGAPSPELYARWLEACAFVPYFRTHSTNTSPPREPWSFGGIVEEISRRYIKRRERWMPYVYTAFEEAARTGLPIARPLSFDFPADPGARDRRYSWLFGPSLLVAPVVEEGAVSREVYLPAGSRWIDFWSDEIHEGGSTVVVDAPLGVLPLFVREGGFLPTSYDRAWAEQPLPRDLVVHVYPNGSSQYTLYEDDGLSFAFESGELRRTTLTSQATPAELRFTTSHSGSFDPGPRSLTLVAHRSPRPTAVTLDGAPLAELLTPAERTGGAPGWYHESASGRLHVRFADAGQGVVVVTLPAAP